MASLFGKLKSLLRSPESKPVKIKTESLQTDNAFLLQGTNNQIPAWHFLLVSSNKILELKSQKLGTTVDIESFGSVIEYFDENGKVDCLSGWGKQPPKLIQQWIQANYIDRFADEKTFFKYENDDIRLCTIQKTTPKQLIGIFQLYDDQEKCHYVKLVQECKTSLAYRSGIKDYDRIIYFNEFNIENDSMYQLMQRFENQLNVPFQLLVCSPGTHRHYKLNRMIIHRDLPTVRHLKPVFDTLPLSLDSSSSFSSTCDQCFYVIQCENDNCINVVSQSSIFKSLSLININDICFVEMEGKYQKSQIKFKGSKGECEAFCINFIEGRFPLNNINNKEMVEVGQCEKTSSKTTYTNTKMRFEDLPNELLYNIFEYLTLEELYDSFHNLQNRFTQLLKSQRHASLVINQKCNPLVIKFYKNDLYQLVVDASSGINLSEFVNLRSLVLCNRHQNYIKQIQPETLPNLVYLSFLLNYDFKPPQELVNNIFSNRFQYLRCVNLGWIDKPSPKSWTISPSIKVLSIRCEKFMIIEDILQSCVNLIHLQIHLLRSSNNLISSSTPFQHSIEKLTIWTDHLRLKLEHIDFILSYTPNIRYLYLQTQCDRPFIEIVHVLTRRLPNLSRFNCYIKEYIHENDGIPSVNTIQQISPCFQRIRCVTDENSCRIFLTD